MLFKKALFDIKSLQQRQVHATRLEFVHRAMYAMVYRSHSADGMRMMVLNYSSVAKSLVGTSVVGTRVSFLWSYLDLVKICTGL